MIRTYVLLTNSQKFFRACDHVIFKQSTYTESVFNFNMLRIRIHIPLLDFVHVFKVTLQDMLVLEHPRANVALKGLDVTNTMNR